MSSTSLFFPAFRVKADVLPSRYRTMWFQATKTGRFHIFCAEYCGTLHSGMIGWVEVMEPTDYQRWLAGGAEGSLASQGEKLFQKYACNTCHTNDATGRGPVLAGLYGTNVTLRDNTHGQGRRELHPRVDPQSDRRKSSKASRRSCRRSRGRSARTIFSSSLSYVNSLGAQKRPSFRSSRSSHPNKPSAGSTAQARRRQTAASNHQARGTTP